MMGQAFAQGMGDALPPAAALQMEEMIYGLYDGIEMELVFDRETGWLRSMRFEMPRTAPSTILPVMLAP